MIKKFCKQPKKNIFFLYQKLQFFILRPPWRTFNLQKHSVLRTENPALWNFFTFIFLEGLHLCPPGSGSGTRRPKSMRTESTTLPDDTTPFLILMIFCTNHIRYGIFYTFKKPSNRFKGLDSASLCSPVRQPYSCARIYRPSFHKNKPKRSFSVIQNERFGLVFAKTRSIISGTGFL